jgi:selenide,water dikinase
VSIDIGSSPAGTPPQHVIPVKPIALFCAQYQQLKESLQEKLAQRYYTPDKPFTLLVVGGGAGGIELALSVQYNLQGLCKQEGVSLDTIKVMLATRGDKLMEQHNRGVQQKFQRILRERNVEVRYGAEVVNVEVVASRDGTAGKSMCLQ